MKIWIALTAILLNVLILSGQNSVEGRVVSKTSENGLPYAEINLILNGEIVNFVVADEEGNYSIRSLESGKYQIRVSYLGFSSYEETIDLKEDLVWDILLSPSAENLDEVVVTAKKTSIQFFPDKTVVDVGNDLLSAGAGAEDILRQIPAVDVDPSGNVTLRNNTNVVIMIDGKKSPLSSADVIAQIPSSNINKIEIITNPSARYDAEGVSGIINIITVKKESFGGSFSLGAGIGEDNRYHFTTNGNYRTAQTNFFMDYGFRKHYNEVEKETVREGETFDFEQEGVMVFREAISHNAKAGVDIFLDTTQTLTPSGFFNLYKHIPTSRSSTIVQNDERAINTLDYFSTDKHNHSSFGGNLNYRKEFDGRSSFFEADVNVASYRNMTDLNSVEIEMPGRVITLTDDQDLDNLITTISADYYLKNDDQNVLEVGLKYEKRDMDHFQERTFFTEIIENLSNEFDYQDQVFAAYAVYERRFDKFSLKGGLRVEHTSQVFGEETELAFAEDYTDFFPSLSASFSLGSTNFSASYSRRISRPGIHALNPFTVQMGEFTQRRGNPELEPSYAGKMEINVNQKMGKHRLNTSLFYSDHENLIEHVFVQEGEDLITTFANTGNSTQYGGELNFQAKIFQWWDSNFSANLYFSEYETTQFRYQSNFFQQYSLRNSFNFGNGWSAILTGSLYPEASGLQQTREGFYRVDSAISKRLFEGKGQLSLRVNDIFSTHEINVHRVLPELEEIFMHAPAIRYLYLSYRHQFSFGRKDFEQRARVKRNYESGSVG